MYAHRELEYLTLDKKTQAFNEVASNKFTDLYTAANGSHLYVRHFQHTLTA